MEKTKGTAATRAKNKYFAENYERLYPFVKKGKKERYQEAAARAGYSLNEFIEKAMDKMAEEILGE
uniref:Antitoxin n=1 Tax=Dulem virus 34 TaxID=3145752 RepID=A0AAU8B563_9CAUD